MATGESPQPFKNRHERRAEAARRPPVESDPEVFGLAHRPHIRWSCTSCGKRVVSKLLLPVAKTETKWCPFCHKASSFGLKVKS